MYRLLISTNGFIYNRYTSIENYPRTSAAPRKAGVAQRIETPRRPRRRTFYPWKDWLDGELWSATRGEDFFLDVKNFQSILHMRARQEGMDVETGSPEKGIVEFQFKRRETPKVPVGTTP
jgi:hypothetical protein